MTQKPGLPSPPPPSLPALARALALAAVLPAVAASIAAAPVAAQLEIDITRGRIEPLPIAIPRFHATGYGARRYGADIAAVVASDLESSGLFRALDPDAFLRTPEQLHRAPRPRFSDWRQVDAHALVAGRLEVDEDEALAVEFRLWDVLSEHHMVGFSLRAPRGKWRRVAHLIADEIYRRITGEDGYFDTRIVYIAETGPHDARVKRLAIMDQDGANARFLTDGVHLALTPRFSPTLQEIAYLSYVEDRPRVYLRHIDTGREEILGDFGGQMSIAPRFSPDGNKMVMSVSLAGNSEIFELDLRNRVQLRLTRHPAIDTAPSFSPDGAAIAFESDRSGSQQIYVMASDGSRVERISFDEGRYATPVWSPRGDWIAFTKSRDGVFYIGAMRPDGSDERLLTQGFLVEGPTWAPNGRVLMYYRHFPGDGRGRAERVRLYSIDVTGRNEREIVTATDASDPAWSPPIPRH